MNKKADGPFKILFVLAIVIIGWALLFADQLAYWGAFINADNGLTGVEAWFYGNLNLVIGLVLVVAVVFIAVVGWND